MKTNVDTKFSDGTICDYCGNLVLTKLGLNYKVDEKDFCCKECADDYKKK
jgi:hypothetical protein